MFTGIVQELLTVTALSTTERGQRVVLTRPSTANYALGDSILLDGICSTIVTLTSTTITVEYMPQTVQLTTAAQWFKNKLVNSEAPLTLQTKLSGALVLGHVDTTATVANLQRSPEQTIVTLGFTAPLPGHVVAQGGLTINGVNLTIVSVSPRQVVVHLIPYTWEHTSWQVSQVEDQVNIEFDYLAKLLWAQAQARALAVA